MQLDFLDGFLGHIVIVPAPTVEGQHGFALAKGLAIRQCDGKLSEDNKKVFQL